MNLKKCKVLHWQRIHPMHQHTLVADQLESNSAEKDLVVLVDMKLTLSQQCTPCSNEGQ